MNILEIINNFKKTKKLGLFYEMGLGKTYISLSIINELLKKSNFNKILIIAPLQVVKTTWEDEINKWEAFKNIKIKKIIGNEKKRLEAINDLNPFNIVIFNKENTQKLLPILTKKYKFSMLIIDESTTFKSSTSLRFRALKSHLKYFKYRLILTGMPTPQNYIDLWAQIYILDEGHRLYKHKGHYLNKFFYIAKKLPNNVCIYDINENNKQEILNVISDITLVKKNENKETIKVGCNFIKNEIEMTKKVKEYYNKMIKEEIPIDIPNAASHIQKILQVANGFYYDKNKSFNISKYKIKYIDKLIKKYNENVILVYNFIQESKYIKEYFKDNIKFLTDNINENIKLWNEKKIKILAIHPSSCAHGLNLQEGGRRLIWMSPTYKLESFKQTNARLFRRGQKKDVYIHMIIAKNTIEDRILNILNKKDINQKTMLDILKKEITKLKKLNLSGIY